MGSLENLPQGAIVETANPSSPEISTIVRQVDGGHMLYQKFLALSNTGDPLFIKVHDDSLFTDPTAAEHSKQYLHKEGLVFKTLRTIGYPYIPAYTSLIDNGLFMSAYRPEDGWYWELPESPDLRTAYVQTVLSALEALEQYPATLLPDFKEEPALDELFAHGWRELPNPEIQTAIKQKLRIYAGDFHTHVTPGLELIHHMLENPNLMDRLTHKAYMHTQRPRAHIAHFDARQSNIAWHPGQGVVLVDWSWTSAAPPGCDKTMFLIDLFKSGLDVSSLISEQLDYGHAYTLLGYWLFRSTLPERSHTSTVRFHQLASAASAATLLLEQSPDLDVEKVLSPGASPHPR